MSEIKEKLFHTVHEGSKKKTGTKITIVGAGAVGMATAVSILLQNVTNNLALVDAVEDKLQGELLDLLHGSFFFKGVNLNASTDYAITDNSDLIIITAGARQKEGETRLNLVQKNVEILKEIIPKLLKYSPCPIIMVVSNPVDVLTQVVWKLSGLPKHKVIGSGTNLDSLRFRYILAGELNIAVESVHGYIIGEHGDSSVPVWSAVNVGGCRLRDLDPTFGEPKPCQLDIHKEVVESAYKIIKLKGSTCWGVGLSVAHIATTILKQHNRVHPVSVSMKGQHGIEDDVYASLPCVLGPEGVVSIVTQTLNCDEICKLRESSKTLKEIYDGIKF